MSKANIVRDILSNLLEDCDALSIDLMAENLVKVHKLGVNGLAGQREASNMSFTFFLIVKLRLESILAILEARAKNITSTGVDGGSLIELLKLPVVQDVNSGAEIVKTFPISSLGDDSNLIASVGVTSELWMKPSDDSNSKGNRI